MITAIDSNILLDVLIPNEAFYERSAAALQDAAQAGSLAIADIVYAEICIYFETQRECYAFLDANEIRVQALTRKRVSWRAAHGGRTSATEESAPEFWRTF